MKSNVLDRSLAIAATFPCYYHPSHDDDPPHTTTMDGGSADIAGANLCRPPWMVEVQILQEQISADPHGCGKCGKCMEQFLADPHGCGKCGKCMEQFLAALQGCRKRRSSMQLLSATSSMEIKNDKHCYFIYCYHSDNPLIDEHYEQEKTANYYV